MNLKSGYPYSLVKHGLVADYPKLLKNIRTPVVILGGGISGALAAYHLMQKGIDCTIIDARSIGLGSSCSSTSLLQYEIDTPLHELAEMIGEEQAIRAYKLCEEAIEKLIGIADKIGFKDIQPKKSFFYAAAKKDVAKLRKEFEMRKKAGFAVQWLDEEQVKKKMGISAPAAILSQSGAQTNAYLFTHALHQYGLKRGLKIFDRTLITDIKHQKSGVTMKTEDGYSIKADSLIYATGYEVVQYIDKPIVKLQSTFAVISEVIEGSKNLWKENMLLWNTADPYLYLRTTADNRILIGGRDEDFFNPHKRDKLLPAKTRSLVKDFQKLFPDLPFNPEFSWAGTFGSTKDGLPF
ncbi:MAG: FAD-binding oxidoreductase, partial [Chitinophagaceae bacterium]